MTSPYPITDWDDAYQNGAYIPGSDTFVDRWNQMAAGFRSDMVAANRAALDLRYGERPRNTFDLFRPEGVCKGLVVFIHGGYWKAFDKSTWSHLAQGALQRGHAVAMPSYTLAPEATIAEIGEDIAAAIGSAAAEIDGPIRLCGHSAGGQLAARMICETSPLAPALLRRVANTVAISGVHDLRPLMRTAMNETLGIDEALAAHESPALLRPIPGSRIVGWVGADERPEFLRQNRLLGLIWDGFGIETSTHEEPGRHHFDVIEGLCEPDHPLLTALIGLP